MIKFAHGLNLATESSNGLSIPAALTDGLHDPFDARLLMDRRARTAVCARHTNRLVCCVYSPNVNRGTLAKNPLVRVCFAQFCSFLDCVDAGLSQVGGNRESNVGGKRHLGSRCGTMESKLAKARSRVAGWFKQFQGWILHCSHCIRVPPRQMTSIYRA